MAQVPYALFAYSALIPWTMFSSALTNACTALTSHAALLTKVYFPREILPLTYIVAALVDMAAASVVLAALMMWFGVSLTATAIWALPAIAILTGLLVGLGLLASALQVRYRDVGLAMPVLVQIWLFASPVLYPLAAVKAALAAPLLHALHPQSDGRRGGHVSPRGGAASVARSARARHVRARRRRYRAGSLRLLQVRRADDGGRRMSDATVDVAIENVWKQYRLSTSRNARTFWALQDVSLNVLRGASVGVIGRNGAGKSTLLKLLAGITAPTRGRIVIHGRVAALIEVGSGFHPELTGRENVFLSGAILGMRRREIATKLERIVEFAGVRQFIDTPVKWYSSGMYVRLGFAVAAHMEPDILLVDEVLAVGDAEFQVKCLQRIQELKNQGTTSLLISHDLTAVERLCDRAVLLEAGAIAATGTPADVVASYHRRLALWDPPSGETSIDSPKSGVALTNLTFRQSG